MERHVADAERRVYAQQPEIVVDHVAAFHAHQRGDLVIRGRLSHIRGGRREHQIVGMRANRFAHGVDLIERALHGRRNGDLARHPDREEQRVQASLAHARDVDVAVRVPFADVEGFVEDQPLRRVVVRVDDDRAVVQLLRARGDRICRCLRKDDNRNRQGNRAENPSHCSLVSSFNSRDAKRRSGSLWPRATPGYSSPKVQRP